MSEFIQLHILVPYPPSNLNRDDTGRPKTAIFGGKERLRISSQSLKRAWRTSDLFITEKNAIRSRELGSKIEEALVSGKDLSDLLDKTKVAEIKYSPISAEDAGIWACGIMSALGKVEGDDDEADVTDSEDQDADSKGKKKSGKSAQKSSSLKQIISISRDEIKELSVLLEHISKHENNEVSKDCSLDLAELKEKSKLIKNGKKVTEKDWNKLADEIRKITLKKVDSSIDLAMFGRMLTSDPKYNREAAVQVSHSISVDATVIEDDYFTAVDDLNENNTGSAHINEAEFASGIFYTYVCINRSLLLNNLDNDAELANRSLRALVDAAAKIGPSGKQNSFASRAYASYIIAEKGTQQPRSLSLAFVKPVSGSDRLTDAVKNLEDAYSKMEDAYGKCADEAIRFDALGISGKKDADGNNGNLPKIVYKLSDVQDFVSSN